MFFSDVNFPDYHVLSGKQTAQSYQQNLHSLYKMLCKAYTQIELKIHSILGQLGALLSNPISNFTEIC